MARRVTFVLTGALEVVILLLAYSWTEAWAPILAVALGLAAAGGWLAFRFPSRPLGRHELQAIALALVASSLIFASWFPSTRVLCDCPSIVGSSCHCPTDHHIVLRVTVVLVALVLGVAALVAEKIRRSRLQA